MATSDVSASASGSERSGPQPRGSGPPKSLPEGWRIYAIGDCHGRADLVEEMQASIAAHMAASPLPSVAVIWLGDFVDRGPASRRVIDLLLGFAQRPHRSIFLMGNHEEALLRFLDDPRRGPQWCSFGGIETLASYGVDVAATLRSAGYAALQRAFLAALPEAHRQFFLSLTLAVRIGDFFFCHAGVRPGVRLDEQDPQDLIWIRDEFLQWRHDFGATVVHGHTPVAEPDLRPNRVNVDTGAFATGRLTCAVIEGSRIEFLSARQ